MLNLREPMLRTAIGFARGANQPLDVEHVAPYLPDTFDLSQDEIDAMVDAPVEQVESAAVDENADVVVADDKQVEPAVVDEQVEPVALTPTQASEALIEARLALPVAIDRQRRARAILADRVRDYRIAIGQPTTQENLCRQFIASEQELRRQKAAGMGPNIPRHPGGPTLLDQQRLYAKSSSLEGTGDQGRRGAQPASRRGSYDARYDQRLVRPKLPSNR